MGRWPFSQYTSMKKLMPFIEPKRRTVARPLDHSVLLAT